MYMSRGVAQDQASMDTPITLQLSTIRLAANSGLLVTTAVETQEMKLSLLLLINPGMFT
jgi:hypothetical protein